MPDGIQWRNLSKRIERFIEAFLGLRILFSEIYIYNVLCLSQSSSIDEDEMEKMESDAVPQSTSHATKSGVKKLTNWLKKLKINVNFHSITKQYLCKGLRRFYAECKRENGKPLTPSSLVGTRAAISRYVIATPFYHSINLVSGENFTLANKMFDTKCKLYYKSNNPKPKHKAVIEEEDMKRLGQYFKNYHQNPILLTETIWFLLCFHIGSRGREGWAEMKKYFLRSMNAAKEHSLNAQKLSNSRT